jgi:NitT/TauT family transport system substrate-binding protein
MSCRTDITAPAPVRLAIGAQQSPSQLLIYLARELAYFQACGVSTEIEEFPGSAKAMEALLGGSLDVVSGYHEQTMQLPDGAPALQSFVAMTNGHLVALAVSPRATAIERIQQLRGRKAGVTTLGSATHLWLNFLLSNHGVPPDQVTTVAISTAARAVAAMERGVVDAGVVSDFTARTIEKRFGSVRILADTRTPEAARLFYGVAQYPGAALFAQRDWVAGHGAEARALACAVGRARGWAQSHSAEEVAARMPVSHRGEDRALYTEVIRQTLAMLTPDGRITQEGAEAARKLAQSSRPAAESYTNEFLADSTSR